MVVLINLSNSTNHFIKEVLLSIDMKETNKRSSRVKVEEVSNWKRMEMLELIEVVRRDLIQKPNPVTALDDCKRILKKIGKDSELYSLMEEAKERKKNFGTLDSDKSKSIVKSLINS